MKIILKICFIFILIFLCSSCDGDVTRDIRHAGFSVGGKFNCDYFFPKDEHDVTYDRIRYFTGTHIVNENGKLYEVSFSQNYKNKQNCKVADTSIVVQAIFDNKIIKGTDKKYYYLIAQNNVESYSLIPETDNSYHLYDVLLSDSDVLKVITADSSAGLYYVLKSDGNVYAEVVNSKDYNSLPFISSDEIIYNHNDFGDLIIDFNYAGDSLATFVKTNNNRVYRMKIKNSEECGKYADIKCIFSMEEDEIFKTYGNRIIVFNGSTLITDYRQIFNVTG